MGNFKSCKEWGIPSFFNVKSSKDIGNFNFYTKNDFFWGGGNSHVFFLCNKIQD